jgi:antitoxin component YwqK of YwqJK toxin-antitoxin module
MYRLVLVRKPENIMSRNLCISLTFILISLHTSLIACSCINDFKPIKAVEDLKDYEFVALVKVTSETINPPSDSTPFRDATLGFSIIEKFKGKDIANVIENYVQSSCDMGIEVGDEWVLFARTYNGKLTISACNRDVRYRDKVGVRDWHYKRGIQELEDLRQLYGRSQAPHQDGINRAYYPDGKVEIEETYQNNLKNGIQTVFHPSGKIWGKQTFVNDSLQGKSEWYYPSGQLHDQKFYRKGFLINMSRVYYDTTIIDWEQKFLVREFYKTEDSLRKTYSRIQVWMEALYDYDGKTVLSREYSRWGIIQHEYIYHLEDKNYTSVFYHENGQVQNIQHHKGDKEQGHHQEYDPNGNPTRSWDYDENGKQINLHIPRR